MTTHIALLRGINIAGHKQVAMEDLRRVCTRMGFDDVHSLLNSGNLVFRAKGRSNRTLERLLEVEVRRRLAVETLLFVRTAKEWTDVIADNPFPSEAMRDPGHLVVMFLKDPVGARDVTALQAIITGPEIVRGKGKQVYISYPAGIGRSPLTTAVIERTIGTGITGRNWNTVVKLGAIATP